MAEDGESAFEQAELGAPNRILLDVMLPGIDGSEACARLGSRNDARGPRHTFPTYRDPPGILGESSPSSGAGGLGRSFPRSRKFLKQ